MTTPLNMALARFSRADRLIAAAALAHIAAQPGPGELARSIAEIFELLATFVRDSIEATS